jgi:acetyltransferase-like isoleucine patch superfamily enzyme
MNQGVTWKALLASALIPPAALWCAISGPFRRLWWYACLAARVRRLYALPCNVVVSGEVEVHGTADIEVGDNCFFYPGLYFETQGAGRIRIGRNVVLSRGVHVVAFDRVEIEDGAMVGEYTSIRDANHRRDPDSGRPLRQAGYTADAIRIGPEVWIGRGCAILPGVHIGEGATIGANSVVTHDVAPRQVCVGAPARPLPAHEVSYVGG